nr:unnamed protein product [Spirometra erinaceieuropaei]
MQGHRGEQHIDDKLFKEMFLERLPADVQTILASGSKDLSFSRPVAMTDRMLEVQRFQPTSVTQLSSSSLLTPITHLAGVVPVRNFKLPIFVDIMPNSVQRFVDVPPSARSSPSRETSQPKNRRERFFWPFRLWPHPLFLRQCDSQTFPCGLWSPNQCLLPTPADRLFPSPGLHLQAADCSPIPTLGSLYLTLNIGFRRSFSWVYVIADVHHAALGSDFLAEFNLLIEIRRSRLLDRITDLSP